jgi:hypothetical protein
MQNKNEMNTVLEKFIKTMKSRGNEKLYNKADCDPMGCMPGLLAPILALFHSFNLVSLRQKDSFGQMIYLLDSIYELPFHVPLCGNILVCLFLFWLQ